MEDIEEKVVESLKNQNKRKKKGEVREKVKKGSRSVSLSVDRLTAELHFGSDQGTYMSRTFAARCIL